MWDLENLPPPALGLHFLVSASGRFLHSFLPRSTYCSAAGNNRSALHYSDHLRPAQEGATPRSFRRGSHGPKHIHGGSRRFLGQHVRAAYMYHDYYLFNSDELLHATHQTDFACRLPTRLCRYSLSEPEKVDSLKPNNSNKRNHEIDLKRIFNFPNDIKKEIYSYYLDFYRLRMNWNPIHQELTEKEHILLMTKHIFDFSVD